MTMALDSCGSIEFLPQSPAILWEMGKGSCMSTSSESGVVAEYGNKLLDIHCSTCGAPARYDIVRHTYTCAYCGSETGISEALAEKQGFRALCRKRLGAQRESFHAASAHCSGCGATIILPENEPLANCSFCGRALVRKEYLKASEFPELIIPFSLTKEEAIERFEEWCAANSMKREAAHLRACLTEVEGYYLPYELVRGPIDCAVSREGAAREFECGGFLNGIFVNTSKQLDNLTLNGMEPFDLSELQEFDFGYLAQQKAKVLDIDSKQLEWRVAQEVASNYTPIVEKTMETRNIDVKPHVGQLLRMPILLPVYYIRRGDVCAAVNGQTGKVAVRSEHAKKTLPWWIRPIAATLAAFLVAFAIASFVLQNVEGGLVMAGMITLVMGLIFYTAFSNAYEGTKRKTLDPEIFTSDQTFVRGRDGKLHPREGTIATDSVEPLFFEDIDGERTQVQIRFTTVSRTIKMLALGIAVIFLPAIIAFILSGFDYQSLDIAGSAVWLCIFVPVVPAYYIKMGRIDIYENPYVWRIDESGRRRKVPMKSRTTTVKDVVKAFFSPGLIAAGLVLVLFFIMSVYLTMGG